MPLPIFKFPPNTFILPHKLPCKSPITFLLLSKYKSPLTKWVSFLKLPIIFPDTAISVKSLLLVKHEFVFTCKGLDIFIWLLFIFIPPILPDALNESKLVTCILCIIALVACK